MVEKIPLKNKSLLPEWGKAKSYIFPLLEPIESSNTVSPAIFSNDILRGMLTKHIQISLACFYESRIIPLTDSILKQWSISITMLYLALEDNMAQFTKKIIFEKHEKEGFIYYSINTPTPFFNSFIPFYKPMRQRIAEFLDYPFYFAAPERQTVILFDEMHIPYYKKIMRNDVLLTHDCSSHALSPELIQATEEGIMPVMDF